MPQEPKLTPQTAKVLQAILEAKEPPSGSEIARVTRIASGTLYPILLRLEKAGWLESKWEELSPEELGRPRRRFYSVTGMGAQAARVAAREVQAAYGALSWAR